MLEAVKVDTMLQVLEELKRWQAEGCDQNVTVSFATFRAGYTYGVSVSPGWFCRWLRQHNVYYDRHTRTWHFLDVPWRDIEYAERLARIFEVRKVG